MREPMAGAQKIGADILATPEQVARRFFLIGRNMNRGQRAGAIEDGQLARIASIGFYPGAGPSRNQRGGDDLAWYVAGGEKSLELEAAGAGFITAAHRVVGGEPVHEPPDGREIRAQRMDRGRALAWQQDGGDHRSGVLIE